MIIDLSIVMAFAHTTFDSLGSPVLSHSLVAVVVGMNGLTVDEWKTHFSLWAISAAPLWAGIDLTKANQSAIDIFLNKEVIAVDQVGSHTIAEHE